MTVEPLRPATVACAAAVALHLVAWPRGALEQHAAGRLAAAAALARAGSPARAVPCGPNGRPDFPPEFAGSIAHTDRIAVAAVVAGAIGVGVDIETAEISSRVARFVLNERERRTLLTPGGRYTARELFSAKEAGFKALSHVGTTGQRLFWQTELHVRDGAIVARVDGADARTWVCSNRNLSFALAVYP